MVAAACLLVPFFTTSFALGVASLALSLLLVIVAAMMMLSARVGNATRSAPMLTAEELKVMQALGERQRSGGANPTATKPDAMAAAETEASPPSTGA